MKFNILTLPVFLSPRIQIVALCLLEDHPLQEGVTRASL